MAPSSMQNPETQHIILITGPAGSGKTTVASTLASHFGLPYLEGDAFHTPANVEKMRTGHALTDADRWEWLARVRDAAVTALQPASVRERAPQINGHNGGGAADDTEAVDLHTTSLGPGATASLHPTHAAGANGTAEQPARAVVVTCSALKKSYRNVIRAAEKEREGVKVMFVFLSLPEEVLFQRVRERVGHYMKEDMVKSQIEVLEYPDEEERKSDVVVVDASGKREEVEAAAERVIGNVVGVEQR